MDILHSLLGHISTNEFFTGGAVLGIIAALLAPLRRLPYTIGNFLANYFTVTISMNSTDEMFPYFINWITREDFAKSNRRFRLVEKPKKSQPPKEGGMGIEAPELIMAPYQGRYYFRFQGKRMMLTSESDSPSQDKGSFHFFEKLTLRYWGRSLKLSEVIINEVRGIYSQLHKESLHIKIPIYSSEWRTLDTLPHRSQDSVILPDGVMGGIVDDAVRFFDSESWYNERGIPYHRGYLFAGPPGCGKTSAVYALASAVGKSVYSLGSVTSYHDDQFTQLMANLPSGAIVLFEDVDAIFRQLEDGGSSREMVESSKISFSVLLNAIDGFSTKRGCLYIFTTNHPERLDPALIRSGRIDVKINFSPCTKEQVEGMFRRFFPKASDGDAQQFAELLPEGKIAPAQLQEYLLAHVCADDAIKNATSIIADANMCIDRILQMPPAKI